MANLQDSQNNRPDTEVIPGPRSRFGNDNQPTIAVLEYLSGPSIGLESLLNGDQLNISLSADRHLDIISVESGGGGGPDGTPIAQLVRTQGSYRLEALGDGPIWINGRQVDSAELHDTDIIEFGEKGPLSRFQLKDRTAHSRRYFAEICDDCWDYLRTSRKPIPNRVANAFGDGVRQLASQTTLIFRVGMVLALVLIGYVIYQQHQIDIMIEAELKASRDRIENVGNIGSSTSQVDLRISGSGAASM